MGKHDEAYWKRKAKRLAEQRRAENARARILTGARLGGGLSAVAAPVTTIYQRGRYVRTLSPGEVLVMEGENQVSF